MVTPTNVRAGRVTALHGAIQAAKGIPVDDYLVSDSARFWSDELDHGLPPAKSDPAGWMTRPQLEASGRYTSPQAFLAGFSCKATPWALRVALRSNWGPYAYPNFTLADQVNEWLSILFIEDVRVGAAANYSRLYDAWIHRLALTADLVSPLMLVADCAAEGSSPVAALGGPDDTIGVSAQGPVEDKNVFPGRLVRLFRDPAGANQEIDLQSIEVTLDQGLETYWDMMRAVPAVFKAGFPGPRVTIEISALISDETWAILSAAIAGTRQRYRLTAQAQSPASTLTIDFYEVDFEVKPLGHDGRKYVKFSALGQAHRDSSGNFVSISLS